MTDQTPSGDRSSPQADSTAQRKVFLEKARTSLSEIVGSLAITDKQRSLFSREVDEVERMMERLESGVIHIAVFGMVSRGKSALLNALLGREAFAVGATHGTTLANESASWRPEDIPGVQAVHDGSEHGPSIELIDTPGLNEIDGDVRTKISREVARRADLLLFVVSGDLLRPELEALSELREAGKPIIVVFNMVDLYPQADRDAIYEKIRDERLRKLVKPDDIVLAAGRPKPVRVMVREPDGSTRTEWETPEPMIVDLKLKILDVLRREGDALAALNTMLFVDDIHDRIIERKVELRDEEADALVWKFTITKAVAVACNPVAVADVAGGIGTDIAMVFALSRLYDIRMTRVGMGKLVVQVGKMAGLFTATEVGTHILIGFAKSALVAGSMLSGGATFAAYAAVAPVQALAAGYASRVIGEAAKVYLRNGASWGPSGPKTVIRHILDTLDRDSILRRIRDEVEARLHGSKNGA